MNVAGNFKNDNLSVLSIAPSALYLLASPSTPESARQVIELYLHAENTQEIVGEMLGVSQQTILRIIENFIQNSTDGKMDKDFQPYLYNIWN